MLKVTRDAGNFQARYVLRHAFSGTKWCKQMDQYRKRVEERREQEMKTLANLTGWDPTEIRSKMKPLSVIEGGPNSEEDPAWRERMREMFKKPGD